MISRYFLQGNKNDKLHLIAVLLLSLFVIIDMLNGYLVNEYSVSISVFYKGMVLALAYYLVRDFHAPLFIATAIVVFYFLCFGIIFGFMEVYSHIEFLVKTFSIFILFLFFKGLASKSFGFDAMLLFAFITFGFLMINTILGVLGYGYQQYSFYTHNFGVKGFIFSGNEFSVLLSSSFFLTCFLLYINNKNILYYVVAAGLLAATLSFMKAAVLFTVIASLVFISLHLAQQAKAKALIFIVSIATLISTVYLLLSGYFTIFIDRIMFMHERHGLLSTIFSNRDVWAVEALSLYREYSLFDKIVGTGVSWRDIASFDKPVEIDVIDYLMMYGIVGVVIWLFPFCYMLKMTFSLCSGRSYKFLIFLYVFLIYGISAIAGHVIYSGIASATIAACLSLPFFVGDKYENARNIKYVS